MNLIILLISFILIKCNSENNIPQNSNKFLSIVFGNNMALQRNTTTNSLYGWSAQPNILINLILLNKGINSYNNNSYSSNKLSNQGGYYWKIYLHEVIGGFDNYTISITSTIGETISLYNIVFGDIFFCSGQSNMQFSMPAIFNASAEVIIADDYPFIRILSVGQDAGLPQTSSPLDDVYSIQMPWIEGSSTSINGSLVFSYYSAVCWLTAVELYNKPFLDSKIPIGLVSSNWGGTYIQSWTPISIITECNAQYFYDEIDYVYFMWIYAISMLVLLFVLGILSASGFAFKQLERNENLLIPKQVRKYLFIASIILIFVVICMIGVLLAGVFNLYNTEMPFNPDSSTINEFPWEALDVPGSVNVFQPGILFNTMVAPFRDFNFKGILWYQGESNTWDPKEYPCLQKGMLQSMRNLGDNWIDIPFIYVQLEPWDNGLDSQLPYLRTMQYSMLAETNITAMISVADLGDPYR
jgi:sialate O-acetylesterase